MGILDIVFIVVAILLIVLALLQTGKSEGASGAIMGGGNRTFTNVKERGPELILSRVTLFLGITFFVLAIVVRIFGV